MSASDKDDSNRSCNRVQPPATPRNPVQRVRQLCKTNPNQSIGGSLLDRAAQAALSPVADDIQWSCNPVQPGATPRNPTQPGSQLGKTKPTAQACALTDRQRAAARLIALGRSIPSVAAELKLDRTTVWRWCRLQDFRAELDRLHDRLTLAAAHVNPKMGAT